MSDIGLNRTETLLLLRATRLGQSDTADIWRAVQDSGGQASVDLALELLRKKNLINLIPDGTRTTIAPTEEGRALAQRIVGDSRDT